MTGNQFFNSVKTHFLLAQNVEILCITISERNIGCINDCKTNQSTIMKYKYWHYIVASLVVIILVMIALEAKYWTDKKLLKRA